MGSNVTRRGMIGGLAAGVSGAALISSDTFIGYARAQSARKTFMLVPGGFCGAWYWRRVSDLLEKQGHKAISEKDCPYSGCWRRVDHNVRLRQVRITL